MKDSVAKDVWFITLFGVLPATCLLIGGAWYGGWVLGDAWMPWSALVVWGGVLGAFGVMALAMDLVIRGISERFPCP